MRKGIAGFYGEKGFSIEEDDTFRLQSCLSPVWDTGLAMIAPALVKAGKWLLGEQILTGGDWQVRCKTRPGGWAFEFENDIYPDTDDTAIVMMALIELALDEKKKEEAISRGLEWLLGMQSANGGWGAFDRNNTRALLREIPFADFGEMIDPPSVDVTAHIVELFGRLGHRKGFKPIDRALGAVLPALAAVGEEMDSPSVRRAVDWLISHQNGDGGWGERIEGYYDPAWRGRGPSTASQTAWALLALIAAGEAGSRSLIETQTENGGWDEPYFTGTGFPTDFMINYHLYREVFPVMALGRYRRSLGGIG